MHRSQNRIALGNGVHNHAHGKQIVNLVNALVLTVHFAENAVKMLCPALNVCVNAVLLFDFIRNFLNNVRNKTVALTLFLIDAFVDFTERHRI